MSDPFDFHADSVTSPATAAATIVPSDSDALPLIPKAIYIGSGGTVTMRGKNDNADVVWRNLPDGALLPFRAQYIRATGTTAANMLALY